MKIRMRQNSIRLRLTRSEVALFDETGYLEENVNFRSGTLRYALARSSAGHIHADFKDGGLTVSLPAAVAHGWASSEQVGVQASDGDLAILVEKDFQCAHGPIEGDAYPPLRDETTAQAIS